MKRYFLLAFILLLFSLALRLYDLPETMNFGSDQGEFLLDSAKILAGEPLKLIGIYVSSKPIENKYFFIGSQFSYFLAFWQWLLAYDPLKITAVFAVLNALAVALTFLSAAKWWGAKLALLAGLLYATNSFAIAYSKIIWNPTIQPFLTALALFLLAFGRKTLKATLAMGLVVGLAISAEYGSIILIPIILFLLRDRKRALAFLAGIALGLLNLIIFELRHNFYNSTLLVKYYLSGQSSGLGIHHVLVLLPIIFLLAAGLFSRLKKNWLIFLLFALVFLISPKANISAAATYPDLVKIADLIANNQPKNFNVAQIIDGDSRAQAIRYLVSYPRGLKNDLRAVDAYNQSQTLYLVYFQGQEIKKGGPYELTSFASQREIIKTWEINNELRLSKLAPGKL